jgi:hypothetical protein
MAYWRRMTDSSLLAKKILTEARQIAQNKGTPLAVFDLDSTLFDVSPRLLRIFRDFAKILQREQRYPEAMAILQQIQVEREDWGFKDALMRAGLDGKHPEFEAEFKDFWQKTFFSNEYLDFDIPYPGAQEFVSSLSEGGTEVVYLTGRDQHRMGQGSQEVLLKWGFPLNAQNAKLVLKPHRSLDDALFKTDYFAQLPEKKYVKIWFFENEPLNVNSVREAHSQVEIVFFESTHSRRGVVPSDIPRIMHYLLEP